jgi:hypothetical protein
MERLVVSLKPLHLVWFDEKESHDGIAIVQRHPRLAQGKPRTDPVRDRFSTLIRVQQERDFRRYLCE